jgi:hypothetical protein
MMITLSAGTHVICFEVDNLPPFGAPNPGGVAGAVYIPGFPPTLVWETSNAMKIQEYVSELPGMTVGNVIRLAVQEQIDVFSHTWASDLDLSGFSDTVDSNSDAWSGETNISVQVGHDSVLDLFAKIQDVYGDVRMNPNSWAIDAYNSGNMTGTGPVFSDATRIGELTHGEVEAVAQQLVVLSEILGWSLEGSGEATEFLELGIEIAYTEEQRISAEVISILGTTGRSVAATILPTAAELPWLSSGTGWYQGWEISVPDETLAAEELRVFAITLTQSDTDENVRMAVTLNFQIADFDQRVLTELKT